MTRCQSSYRLIAAFQTFDNISTRCQELGQVTPHRLIIVDNQNRSFTHEVIPPPRLENLCKAGSNWECAVLPQPMTAQTEAFHRITSEEE
jgi:hypothetical protein